jgi:hypothetical protein
MTSRPPSRSFDFPLYGRWVAANGVGELLGLGATGLVGWRVATWLGEPPSAGRLFVTLLVAVGSGTLLEGILVGWAQAWALRFRLPRLRRGRWMAATALGACLAWILGMVPSTLMALSGPAPSGPPPAWLEGPAQYGLAAALGLVLGPVLAIPQSLVLRSHTGRPGIWIVANAVAWALGMPLIFVGVGAVGFMTSQTAAVIMVAATCLAAGVVVGAVHGVALVRLVARVGGGDPARARTAG